MCVAGWGCPDGGCSPPPGFQVSKELWWPVVEDEVGNVDAALVFVECGGTFDAVGDVELARDDAGDGFGSEGPETICSGVGYGVDDASGERQEAVGCEVVFAPGGEPKEFWVGDRANECCFFAFDDSDGFKGMCREEMFSEKALAEAEVAGEFPLGDEDAVEPVEGAGAVFDAVSGSQVVGHDFGCTAVAGGVNLRENDAAIGGGLEPVGVDELAELSGREVKPVGEEAEERGLFGLRGERRGGEQYGGDGGKGVRFVFRRRGNGGNRRRGDSKTAEVVEVLAWGVVVTTGLDAFAASYFFVEDVTGEGVDVADETMGGSTSWTGEAGGDAVVGLEFVAIGVHGLGVLESFVFG